MKKTLKTLIRNRKTRKMQPYLNQKEKSNIVRFFIEMLNTIKLYHWRTRSFAQHKATDELYSKLNENIDTFVEILLGKNQSRVIMMEQRINLYDAPTTMKLKDRIFEYREFLIDLNMQFDYKKDSDLLNVRDEILGNINQFLYLLSFDK
jgi:DNA-binding ferritin-like protein